MGTGGMDLGYSDTKEGFPARPFIKWAGGKGQLIEKFVGYYPHKLKEGSIKTYIEPFLGGGAVLFDVMQRFEVEKAFVFDVNKELINTYQVIKKNVKPLINLLKNLQTEYVSSDDAGKKEMFHRVRDSFNNGLKAKSAGDTEMAAWFVFLNRTCFNGLYRVNKAGLFNVPAGSYKNPTICDTDNLIAVNKLLKKVEIHVGDYRDSLSICTKDSFVYFDPPYRPLNLTSSFTSYSKNDFDDDAQKELAKYFEKCHKKGAALMLSNSDPQNIDKNDDFFDILYKNFNIKRVKAKRSINSDAGKRGLISEILVTNY